MALSIPSVKSTSPNSRKFLWNLKRGDPDDTYAQNVGREVRASNDIKSSVDAAMSELSKPRQNSESKSLVEAYIMMPCDYGGIVDVVADYAWTKSPKEARDDVPYIYMREMHQKRGADLQKLIYYGASLVNSADKVLKKSKSVGVDIGEAISSGLDKFSNLGNLFNSKPSQPNTQAQADNTTGKVKEKLQKTYNAIKGDINTSNTNFDKIPHLNPYDMLYQCNFTGWQYKLPLFGSDLARSTNNAYGDSTNSLIGSIMPAVQKIAELGASVIGTAQQLVNNVQTNIETPKAYDFSGQGPMMEIKFPLLNTESIENAYKNYDFIQLLKYQSRPYRCDKNTIIPTHIYEILIPGFKYFPYVYIQDISVEHKGVRRILPITLKVDGKPTKTTFICPEAYEVTIKLQALTNDTQNFMVEYMLKSRNLI